MSLPRGGEALPRRLPASKAAVSKIFVRRATRRARSWPPSDQGESFGEPAADRNEKIAGLIAVALTALEPRHAHRGAEFPGFCLLRARHRKRALEIGLRFRACPCRRAARFGVSPTMPRSCASPDPIKSPTTTSSRSAALCQSGCARREAWRGRASPECRSRPPVSSSSSDRMDGPDEDKLAFMSKEFRSGRGLVVACAFHVLSLQHLTRSMARGAPDPEGNQY